METTKPVLHYWNGRGRAEFIRLMLAAARVEFEPGPFLKTPQDIKKLRDGGLLMFQQVPLLQMDGKNMVQTGAIVRYIARKYNLYGASLDEAYQVDVLTEGSRDMFAPMLTIGFRKVDDVLKELHETTLPRYLPVFEKALSTSKSGFLVGDKLSMADVSLLEVLLSLEEYSPNSFDSAPHAKAFLEKIRNVPQIAAYLNGPQRSPPNDDRYISEVKATLGF